MMKTLLTLLLILFSSSLFAQLYPMKKGEKWGYIGKEGEWVIEPQYQYAMNFHEGLAAVADKDCWGFIDHEGQKAFDKVYCLKTTIGLGEPSVPELAVSSFSEGLAMVNDDKGISYINKKGEQVINTEYRKGWSFSNGLARVMNHDRLYGYINKEGKEVVKPQYEDALDFSEGLASVYRKGEGWGFINEKGAIAIPLKYNRTGSFHNGRAWFSTKPQNRDDGYYALYGFLTEEGKELSDQYKEVNKFSEGLAPVWLEKGWSYIDEEGKVQIPGPFMEANPFSEGLALVKKDGQTMYIDTKGDIAFDAPNRAVSYAPFINGLAKITFSAWSSGWISSGNNDITIFPYGYHAYINSDGEIVAKQSEEDVILLKEKIQQQQDKMTAQREKIDNRLEGRKKELLKDCPADYSYGDVSENYLEYKIKGRQRRIYFESLDVFRNEEGGYTIYFPPILLDEPQLKKEDLLKYSTFTWSPKETFESNQFSFSNEIKNGGLSFRDDCFFSGYSEEIRDLTDSYKTKLKMSETKKGNRLFLDLSSKSESAEGEMYLQIRTSNIKESAFSGDTTALKQYCNTQKIESSRFLYYPDKELIKVDIPYQIKEDLKLLKTDESRSFTMPYPRGGESLKGDPKIGDFIISQALDKGKDGILIKHFKIQQDNKIKKNITIIKDDNPTEKEVLISPPLQYAKLQDYNINNAEALTCIIPSEWIVLNGKPVLVSPDQLPEELLYKSLGGKEKSVGPQLNLQKIGIKDLPQKPTWSVKKDMKASDIYMVDPQGKLYEIEAEENTYKGISGLNYSLLNLPIPKEVLKQSVINKFSNIEELYAFAEFFMKIEQKMFSDPKEETEKWVQETITRAGLKNLLADSPGQSLQNMGGYMKQNFSQEEFEIIIGMYLEGQEEYISIVKAVQEAKSVEGDQKAFLEKIEPALNILGIEAVANQGEILRRINKEVENKFGENANRYFDVVLGNEKQEESVKIVSWKVDQKNGKPLLHETKRYPFFPFIYSSFPPKEEANHTFSVGYTQSGINLLLKNDVKEEVISASWPAPYTYWDSWQFFSTLPYLEIKDEYEGSINLVEFDEFELNFTTSFNRVDLKVIDMENMEIAGNKKKVWVVEMKMADRIKNIPGLKSYADRVVTSKFNIKEDGTPYALLYMDRTYPHQLYKIGMKDGKGMYFINQGDIKLEDWYAWVLKQ